MSQRQEPTLLRFLALNAPDLLERSRAVRSATENWLSYVPQTFPHYTRHTLLHSQEILTQLSRMLFRDDKPESCVVHLSASEAYLLVLAAYLHDSGMVVSDHEKMRILRSDEWADWTSSGGAAARLQTINSFRRGETPADPTLRDFLADVQIRFLLAEFVRRSHHLRSQDLVIQRWSEFSGAPLDEPDVRTALGSICAAHGLSDQDLEDSQRFPERIDLLGDQVNVRMLAILLRIGDLLDMSYDRACPLLLSAASPLPAESYAHWSQYGSIRHRLTSGR